MIDFVEEKAKRILDKLIALEKLPEEAITDEHRKQYKELEEELLKVGYEYLGNGYYGEIDK